jgi:hypothetical protein
MFAKLMWLKASLSLKSGCSPFSLGHPPGNIQKKKKEENAEK